MISITDGTTYDLWCSYCEHEPCICDEINDRVDEEALERIREEYEKDTTTE